MAFTQTDYVYKIPIREFFREDTINLFYRFWYPPNNKGDILPIDLSLGIRPMWYLCPYRQYDNPVIIKEMVISKYQNNLCSVTLTANDTKHLDYIKYTYQPVLEMIDNTDMRYIRAEGDMMLNPNIRQEIFF